MSETDAEETTSTETEEETQDEPDWQAEAEKWKALARKQEQRAKENAGKAKELESFKASQMSETEKAVAEAEARGRAAALAETAASRAASKIEAALAGVVPDPAVIVEDLNLSRYVTEDGDVDGDAVKALKAKYAALSPAKGTADLKQGARGKNAGDKPDNNQWLRDKVASRQ